MPFIDCMIRTKQLGACSADYGGEGELGMRHAKRFAAIAFVSYGPEGIIPEAGLPARRA